MNISLDIIITHYNEPFEIVKLLLDSIQLQRNVNFNNVHVYIVNDGERFCINPALCEHYTFDINFLIAEKCGVSNARNFGLEKGKSDYIMFCDCDDTFYTVNALYDILKEAETNCDMIINNFYEEVKTEVGIRLSKHKNNVVFVHGKVYNRNFLLRNNLKFNKTLIYHEDYYFNKLCMTIAENIICIDDPIYLWTFRQSSVCRRDADYLQKTYTPLIDVNDCILDRFVELGLLEEITKLVVQFTYSTFFRVSSAEWELSPYLKDTEIRFKKFFRKYRKYYDVCSVQNKREWYNNYRTAAVASGMLFEPITFLEWINKILEVK